MSVDAVFGFCFMIRKELEFVNLLVESGLSRIAFCKCTWKRNLEKHLSSDS